MNQYIGAYQLVDVIGAGGMGEVYRAIHHKIGRVVALKVLNGTAHNPQSVKRFLNEARIQAGLHHPNIATLYDFFNDRGGPCIVMEFVDGQTLEERIRARGFLTPTAAGHIFSKIAHAVHYIHQQGIIHRDLKPNNIKITTSGEVKLLDFGIARQVTSDRLTRIGNYVGTLQYLAPEQFSGGQGDSRSDIWSLGILLYEMLTGSLPFETNSISGYMAAINTTSSPKWAGINTSLPHSMGKIISKCLTKKPGKRYQSVSELLEDFAECALDSERLSNNRVGEFPVFRRVFQPRHGLFGIAGSILIPSLIVGLFLSNQAVEKEATPELEQQVFPKKTTRSVKPTTEPYPRHQVPLLIETSQGLAAKVYIDGVEVGITPFKQFESVGREFELILKHNCHKDITKAIRINPNNNQYKYTLPAADLCNS